MDSNRLALPLAGAGDGFSWGSAEGGAGGGGMSAGGGGGGGGGGGAPLGGGGGGGGGGADGGGGGADGGGAALLLAGAAGPSGMSTSGTTLGKSGMLLPNTEGAMEGPRSALYARSSATPERTVCVKISHV